MMCQWLLSDSCCRLGACCGEGPRRLRTGEDPNSRAPTPFRPARTLGRRTITGGWSTSNNADSRNTRYFVTGLISLPSTDRIVKGSCRCLHHFQSEIPPSLQHDPSQTHPQPSSFPNPRSAQPLLQCLISRMTRPRAVNSHLKRWFNALSPKQLLPFAAHASSKNP
jgi:hypothetical protein